MRRSILALLAAAATASFVPAFEDEPPALKAVHVKRRGPPDVSAFRTTIRPMFGSEETRPELEKWWRIELPSEEAAALLEAARRDPEVESAYVEPVIVPAGFDLMIDASPERCPIQTPSYSPYQVYLAQAPAGIDAPSAWARGARGAAMWFADIEGGWNEKHEDLPGDRYTHVAGQKLAERMWEAHGTAVLGVVAARDNGIGMMGIAPDVERLFTASLAGIGVAAAIDRAQAALRPGDVLLIELQGAGPRHRWLPMEFWDDVYDVIAAATARGVIIVEAAGNGDEDLGHAAYGGKFDRSVRDSGAIMVGAGAPARPGFVDRSRLSFSNYGRRVDLQGWGWSVATLDYGDLQDCGANARKYTDRFNGTSSASPLVAGAALLLESVAKTRGNVLAPKQVRELLTTTGSPQTDGPHGTKAKNIGPRPDLAKALIALDALR